jgi:hypothetical protein
MRVENRGERAAEIEEAECYLANTLLPLGDIDSSTCDLNRLYSALGSAPVTES